MCTHCIISEFPKCVYRGLGKSCEQCFKGKRSKCTFNVPPGQLIQTTDLLAAATRGSKFGQSFILSLFILINSFLEFTRHSSNFAEAYQQYMLTQAMATQARINVFRSADEMGQYLRGVFQTAGDSSALDPSFRHHGHRLLLDLADPVIIQKAEEIELFTPHIEAVLQERLNQLLPNIVAQLIDKEDDLSYRAPPSSASSSALPSFGSSAPLSPSAPPAKRSRSGESSSRSSTMHGITRTGLQPSAAMSPPVPLLDEMVQMSPISGGSVSSRGRGRRTGSQAGTSDGGLKRKRKDASKK
jgi:hypothetical protein